MHLIFFGLGGIGAAWRAAGRRPVMLFSLIGGALILSVIGLVEDRWLLICSLFSLSLIAEMFRPAAAAMIDDVVALEQRPQAFSLMYNAANLGFAIAPPLGGWLVESFSFQVLFLADAATTVLFAVIVCKYLPETSLLNAPSADSPTGNRRQRASTADAVRCLFSDLRFLTFCAGTLLISLVFIQSISTLPLFLMSLGLTRAEFGLLIGVNGILIVVFQLPAIQLLRRFPRISVIMSGELLIGIRFGLTAVATTRLLILGTITLRTTGEVMQSAFKNALAADLAPDTVRGRYMGLFSMSHAVGTTIGPPCGGLILEHYGPQTLWFSCLTASLTAVLLYATSFRRLAAVSRGMAPEGDERMASCTRQRRPALGSGADGTHLPLAAAVSGTSQSETSPDSCRTPKKIP